MCMCEWQRNADRRNEGGEEEGQGQPAAIVYSDQQTQTQRLTEHLYVKTHGSLVRQGKRRKLKEELYYPLSHLLLPPVLSPFTLHSCPILDCEYPNDINRVVIILTPLTAEALLRGTALTALCHPKALTPTPINTYEYWQRPGISIITSQVCLSAPALSRLITLGDNSGCLFLFLLSERHAS